MPLGLHKRTHIITTTTGDTDGVTPSETYPSSSSPAPDYALADNSRVAVIGSGPAGSLFSYFLLDMASRLGTDVHVDIFEAKDFSRPGAIGCNHCGGIISESLVQMLATEGINLPGTVVQRGIDSYVMHTDVGTARIETPLQEKRIAAVHRGSGPKGVTEIKWKSFDGHLLGLAREKGADVIRERVTDITWDDGRPLVSVKEKSFGPYDLVTVAAGVNSTILKTLGEKGTGYSPPQATKTYICEFPFGEEKVNELFGNSMHVFLLDLPRLKFAAFIPKGDFVTMCVLGKDIDRDLVQSFLSSPEVRACFPAGWEVPKDFCQCFPMICVEGSPRPFADRLVFIGDSGVTRLFKDGIGAAYRTAKAAAKTAVFEGVSAEHFRKHYWPACRNLVIDNRFGTIIFLVTTLIQKLSIARRGVLRMVAREQTSSRQYRPMSTVLWDTFTGSAPYREVFIRTLHPAFLGTLLYDTIAGIFSQKKT